jgi:hypothetical protein
VQRDFIHGDDEEAAAGLIIVGRRAQQGGERAQGPAIHHSTMRPHAALLARLMNDDPFVRAPTSNSVMHLAPTKEGGQGIAIEFYFSLVRPVSVI